MNTAQALHSAARRYCIDNHRRWCEVYVGLPGQGRSSDGYSPKAQDTFPRYNMLNAIRVAVETIDSDSLEDFAAARSLILNAGSTAEDDVTRNPRSRTAGDVQSDEREKFCDFVGSLTESDVWNHDALPYRRVLTKAESDHLWSALGSAWSIVGPFWYPLVETSVTDIAAFKADDFHEFVPAHALRRTLADFGIDRIWELREHGPEYMEDVELLDPIYDGAEGVWTAPGYSWIIYASHESSVTVAGSLLPQIKRMWPNWQLHKWSPW